MTEPLAPPRPSYEVGYVLPNGTSQRTDWSSWVSDERVPELRWPHSIEAFRRMRREDGRVSSVLSAITLPIRRTPWRIEQGGASDEVTAFVAANLGLPIVGQSEEDMQVSRTRGRFSWSEHLRTALLMLVYGHSYFEQIYALDDSGKFVLRKLAPRPQSTIERFEIARDGGLDAIVQRAPDFTVASVDVVRDGGIRIPVSSLVAYVRDPEPGDWRGESLLRPAWKHWLLKDELMRIEAATARRNGMGVPVAYAPENETDIEHYQTIASAYRGGESSGVGMPFGSKLELLGVQGNLPDMRQAIEYHDRAIALAGLAHFLNLDRGGSYALASVQADTFVQSVQTFAESIRDTANQHVVEDLVDINFGPDAPAPKLVLDEIGSRQDLTAAALKMLIDAGLIRLDRDLEEYTRQQYGLPPKGTPAPPAPQDPNAAPTPTASASKSRRTPSAPTLF